MEDRNEDRRAFSFIFQSDGFSPELYALFLSALELPSRGIVVAARKWLWGVVSNAPHAVRNRAKMRRRRMPTGGGTCRLRPIEEGCLI